MHTYIENANGLGMWLRGISRILNKIYLISIDIEKEARGKCYDFIPKAIAIFLFYGVSHLFFLLNWKSPGVYSINVNINIRFGTFYTCIYTHRRNSLKAGIRLIGQKRPKSFSICPRKKSLFQFMVGFRKCVLAVCMHPTFVYKILKMSGRQAQRVCHPKKTHHQSWHRYTTTCWRKLIQLCSTRFFLFLSFYFARTCLMEWTRTFFVSFIQKTACISLWHWNKLVCRLNKHLDPTESLIIISIAAHKHEYSYFLFGFYIQSHTLTTELIILSSINLDEIKWNRGDGRACAEQVVGQCN